MKLFVLAVMIVASPAIADKREQADALFKKARKLHGDKKYAEACPMFEKSDKLDPGIGAKVNVARCYEDWGMLARAYVWYVDAEKMAKDTDDKRAGKIREFIDAIDPDVPRITLNLPEGTDVAKANPKLDGKPVDVGRSQRVDPGPHEITWLVDGKRKSKTIPMERGGERELMLDMRAVVGEGEPIDEVPKPESPPDPGRTRRLIGISVGAAGLVGLGVASYLTLDARSTYKDALDTHCMGETNMCTDEGLKITGDARSQANVATVVTVISLVAIGGGVALYLTAPKASKESAVTVTPVVGDGMGGVIVRGGF